MGDSREYRFDGEAMHQISEDHSYVEETPPRQDHRGGCAHPSAENLITRAVGVEPCVEGDLFEVRLNEKDMLLLCSDGLTGMAEDSRIAEVLANAPTLELAGDALLQLALDGGGRDNITVALFTLGKKSRERDGLWINISAVCSADAIRLRKSSASAAWRSFIGRGIPFSGAMWHSRCSKKEFAEDPDIRKRFSIESRAVAKLSHHNIVSVFDVGSEDGTDYIVMELIEGITLKQYLQRKGHLSWGGDHFLR